MTSARAKPFDYLGYLLREMVLSDDPDELHLHAVQSLFSNQIAEAKAQGRAEALAEAVAEARAEAKREAVAELSAFVAAAVAAATPRVSRAPLTVRRNRR